MKKFHFSKPKRVVLKSENRFFLGKEEKYGDPWLLGEEDQWLISCYPIFFGGGRTRVEGLKLKVAGIFSSEIKSCFLI